MDAMTKKTLELDLQNLSQEELNWLHELKNRAAAMTGRLQLKHLREEMGNE
jgi:hypothetical protein